MNKKGFTLIELLAVIVILAIIAMIATPIVLGIIDDARENANKQSVREYGRTVENTYMQLYMNNNGTSPTLTDVLAAAEDAYAGTRVTCTGDPELGTNGTVTLRACKTADGKNSYDYIDGAAVLVTAP